MRRPPYVFLAVCFAAGFATACGSSSGNGAPSGSDGGGADSPSMMDGQPPPTDGGIQLTDSGMPITDGAIGQDAADGGCNFATFVLGLIDADTNMSALPSTDLGQNCVDNMSQAEFQSLF